MIWTWSAVRTPVVTERGTAAPPWSTQTVVLSAPVVTGGGRDEEGVGDLVEDELDLGKGRPAGARCPGSARGRGP